MISYTEQKFYNFCRFFYKILKLFKIPQFLGMFGIHIYQIYYSLICIPAILKTYYLFLKQKDDYFKKIKYWFITGDIKQQAGDVQLHYFHQDLLIAQLIYEKKPQKHIDVASRLDGFIAHVLTFMPVTMVDVRPLNNKIKNLSFIQGVGENMKSFTDNSVESLSCLHALEHFGLGRYGDPVDLQAIYKTANEFTRVLQKNGRLYVSVPICKENIIMFNSCRVFCPKFFVEILFKNLRLEQMHCIDDDNNLIMNSSYKVMQQQKFGCGLFVFNSA